MSAHPAILDAAETVFGTHGFDGGSMREIAEVAGVAQALLHYHYKNKQTLYEAVFERRAEAIRDARKSRLDELFASHKSASLDDVLAILFMPLEELTGEKRGNLRNYVQMLAEVTIRGDERSTAIVERFYDPSAEHFIKAFRKVVPHLSRENASWAYLFAIGARMQAHAPNNRAARLIGGSRATPSSAYKLLAPFVAAGIHAIAARSTKRDGKADADGE